jgi:hypothetical protein
MKAKWTEGNMSWMSGMCSCVLGVQGFEAAGVKLLEAAVCSEPVLCAKTLRMTLQQLLSGAQW